MKNSYEMARQNDGEYHFEINEEIIMSCHGVSIDKIPTLRSPDTANPPPSKEITGNHPQQPTSAIGINHIDPYSNGAMHRGSKPLPGAPKSRVDSRLPHFLSVLPPTLDPNISRRPSLLTEKVGMGQTSYTLSR
ncbi:hypothetical protein CapIbe_023426 [Capra ibex]